MAKTVRRGGVMSAPLWRRAAMIPASAIALAVLAGSVSGCADGQREDRPRYGGSAVVQGGQCFARTRDGRLVRVAPSNCPELRQPADETAADGAPSGDAAAPAE